MKLHRALVWAVLALFLGQRFISVGELFHHHEEETESSVPTLCHTCHEGCPSDEGHHHHEPGSDHHSDGLCPSCVKMFVHLPQTAAPVALPEPAALPDGVILAPLPGEVHASLHCCRAPPSLHDF
jgi:hypothetical protein